MRVIENVIQSADVGCVYTTRVVSKGRTCRLESVSANIKSGTRRYMAIFFSASKSSSLHNLNHCVPIGENGLHSPKPSIGNAYVVLEFFAVASSVGEALRRPLLTVMLCNLMTPIGLCRLLQVI